MEFGYWDLALLLVVTAQATALAYLRQPRLKALLLCFPFPFSLAYLSLGQPVDATNVVGMPLLLVFFHTVRWLHVDRRWPIVLSILMATLWYSLLGLLLARALPAGDDAFWVAWATVMPLSVVALRLHEHRAEPAHRSPLPVYIKGPLIMAVIATLIVAKQWLRGFMTMFPMVSVVAAYEARHSLWTMTRQIPVMMLTLGPMMVAIHLAQPRLGPVGALLIGWVVFGASLAALHRWQRQTDPPDSDVAIGAD